MRKIGSYYQSLLALNERMQAQGKPPVDDRCRPENLEDDDLLEMVNAGLIPAIVVDDYLAASGRRCFRTSPSTTSVALRTGGNLAVAIRKNSPQLPAALNGFIGEVRARNGLRRRVLKQRYLVKHEVREERRIRGGAEEVPRHRRSSSGSTATGTSSITC